jgi:hypothetical protein
MREKLKAARPRRDDLPTVKSSRLRELGIIKHGMPEASIEVGGLVRPVKLLHLRLRFGGSWSSAQLRAPVPHAAP